MWEKNLEEYKRLVRNAKFVCKSCGRTAENRVNLCEPEPL
jgi:transposase-like protein